MFANRNLDFHARRHVLTQNFGNFRHWTTPSTRSGDNLSHHHLTMTSTIYMFCGYNNVLGNSGVVRHHHGNPLLDKKAPHNILGSGFDHANNACFGAAFEISASFFCQYDIAVQHQLHLVVG